jgi:hypothetical protein
MSKSKHSQKSNHSHKSKKCKKTCFCLRVPHVVNPSYSVENLSENPIVNYKKCKKCCRIKQHPFNQTVVVTPIPVAPFY